MTLNINSVEHYSGQDITAGNLNAPHNEIVSYINNLQTVQYVISDITKTVGSGGDFTNVQDAIDFFGTLVPNKNAVRGKILLKSGFEWNEGVLIESKNLGWVDIESEDPTVIVDPNQAFNPPNQNDVRLFSLLGSKSTMPNLYLDLVAKPHSVNNYRVVGVFNKSSLEISRGRGSVGGGQVRNNNSSGSNNRSIEVSASFVYALETTFDSVLLNINASMMFRRGQADDVYITGYSFIDLRESTILTANINIPTNTFTPYGVAFF